MKILEVKSGKVSDHEEVLGLRNIWNLNSIEQERNMQVGCCMIFVYADSKSEILQLNSRRSSDRFQHLLYLYNIRIIEKKISIYIQTNMWKLLYFIGNTRDLK